MKQKSKNNILKKIVEKIVLALPKKFKPKHFEKYLKTIEIKQKFSNRTSQLWGKLQSIL
jgi:hypothetical protein